MTTCTAETKMCAACGDNKPLAAFPRRRDSTDGRRQQCATCRRKRDRSTKARSKRQPKDEPVVTPRGDYLDAAPFVAWLTEREAFYGTRNALCKATGLDDRRVRSLMAREQLLVAEQTVDFALITEGTAMLMDLYPELYPGLYDDIEVAS